MNVVRTVTYIHVRMHVGTGVQRDRTNNFVHCHENIDGHWCFFLKVQLSTCLFPCFILLLRKRKLLRLDKKGRGRGKKEGGFSPVPDTGGRGGKEKNHLACMHPFLPLPPHIFVVLRNEWSCSSRRPTAAETEQKGETRKVEESGVPSSSFLRSQKKKRKRSPSIAPLAFMLRTAMGNRYSETRRRSPYAQKEYRKEKRGRSISMAPPPFSDPTWSGRDYPPFFPN